MFAGSGSDPAAERDHADPAGLHEAAAGAAGKGCQETEGEAETTSAGCGEWRLWWSAWNGEEWWHVLKIAIWL